MAAHTRCVVVLPRELGCLSPKAGGGARWAPKAWWSPATPEGLRGAFPAGL